MGMRQKRRIFFLHNAIFSTGESSENANKENEEEWKRDGRQNEWNERACNSKA